MSDNETSSRLPATWTRLQLGDIGVVHCGQSPPTAAVNKEGRGTPYVTGPEQWDGSRLHMDKWTTEPKRMAPAGSVFVTVKGAGVGTVFPGVAAAIGRDVYAFVPKPGISPAFVEHALRFTVQDVIRHAVGDIPGLSKSHITDHWIGLPPAAEQQLIVAAIESYFSRLDAATATLERVQCNLERYRASVLKAAVEGRLVPTEADLARKEGRTYEPASTLLKRILTERRRRWEEAELAKLTAKGKKPTDDKWKAKYEEPTAPDVSGLPDLPEGWCWASMDQLGSITGGITKNATREKLAVQRPYLRVANVYANELRLEEIKQIGVSEDEAERTTLHLGDLLIVEGNGSVDQVGRVALWDGSVPGCVHQNHIIRVRGHEGMLPKWSLTWLLSASGRQHIERAASSTSGLHTLSLSKVAILPVPLPPANEQGRARLEVERLISEQDHLHRMLSQSLHRMARLRQSILKWAFEGRLVDPGQVTTPPPPPTVAAGENPATMRRSASTEPSTRR